MIEAFDGAAGPLAGIWPGVGALVALAACLAWKLSGRKVPFFLLLIIGVVGIFAGIVPSWDQIRLRGMLKSGEGLTVTRGTVNQTWHYEERRRDTSSSMRNSYKTVISEGFDVGADRFSWVVGQCLSPASLCELARSNPAITEGDTVEVTWFADPAQVDERRILRLRISPRAR